MALFSREQNPPAYNNSRQYKPFLRLDFRKRCAYCERPESYMGGEDAFEVEHFKPRSKFPQLEYVYPNLYYVCSKCNRHKSETWPSEEQLAQGMRFADPCEEDPYAHHFLETEDGGLKGTTLCGNYTIAHIRLHRDDLRNWRRLRAQALTRSSNFKFRGASIGATSFRRWRFGAGGIEGAVKRDQSSN